MYEDIILKTIMCDFRMLILKKLKIHWVWWYKLLNPALRKQKQTDLYKFMASQEYMVTS